MSRLLDASRVTPILEAITVERQRQENIGEEKRSRGIDWRSCADPRMPGGDTMRLAVLAEEFGEVARAILEAGFIPAHLIGEIDAIGDSELREELQVAAVAVAWIEAIDRRAAK